MFENISSTLGQCGCFFAAGIVMGLFYELLRAARILVRHNAAAVFIEDVLFFSACGFISFVIALSVGIGYFRIYYVFFETLGAILYFLTLGRVLNFLLRKLIKGIKRFFYAVYKKMHPKMHNFFVSIAKKIKPLFGNIAEIIPKISFNRRKDLPNTDDMVYNIKAVSGEGSESNSAIKAQIRKKT